MGTISAFKKENLIIGVLSVLPEKEDELIGILEKHFGKTDLISSVIDFTWTKYYDPEMGNGIRRFFISFEQLVNPEKLSDIKHLSNEIEKSFTVSGSRKINLDPGMLDFNRLILATTKNVGHRIPLKNGIYGEVALIYIKKNFHPLQWTYPDYKSKEYIEILHRIRSLYKIKLSREGCKKN